MISRQKLLALQNALADVLGELEKPAPRKRLTKEQKIMQELDRNYHIYKRDKKQKS